MPHLSHSPPETFQFLCHVSLLVEFFIWSMMFSKYVRYMEHSWKHIRSEIHVSITLPITYNIPVLIVFLANNCSSERAFVGPLQIITELLSCFMEQGPSRETIPYKLVIFPKYYGTGKISWQIVPVYVPSRNILIIYLITIVPSIPESSTWFLSIMFPNKTMHAPLLSHHYMPYASPSDYSQFDQRNSVW